MLREQYWGGVGVKPSVTSRVFRSVTSATILGGEVNPGVTSQVNSKTGRLFGPKTGGIAHCAPQECRFFLTRARGTRGAIF